MKYGKADPGQTVVVDMFAEGGSETCSCGFQRTWRRERGKPREITSGETSKHAPGCPYTFVGFDGGDAA